MIENMKTAIVGGGAAGFFLAVNLKEMCPQMGVTIFEKGSKVLRKVAVSGGGRCNITNSFEHVSSLSDVYPRGFRLMKRLFNVFNAHSAYAWFEQRGLPLTVQEDGCVFPESQDSATVIRLLTTMARRLGVSVVCGKAVEGLDELAGFDYVAVTTGGFPRSYPYKWLADMGHEVVEPVPSLFSFSIEDEGLRSLKGIVVQQASAMIVGTSFRSGGPLLVTHWGMSGPCILRLSSYGARFLSENDYQTMVSINWVDSTDVGVKAVLESFAASHRLQQCGSHCPFPLSQRLWTHLLHRALGVKAQQRWADMGKKDMNRLVNVLVNDVYRTAGRAPFADEFVTCGGIALGNVKPQTLESKVCPGLYFAGEVLDIDGITGGFNFQAAWTTAYVVSCAISDCAAISSHP